MLEIRRCRTEEAAELMEFLGSHWQTGHVLSTSQALLDWQHLANDGHYNYLLAKSDEQIVGVLGYISSVRFDPHLHDRNVIWLALWKVRDDCKIAGLGLRLLGALARIEPHAALAVNGINAAHPPMYKALGFRAEELVQHFLVNPEKRQTLIEAPANWTPRPPSGAATTFTQVDADRLGSLAPQGFDDALPRKTPAYFRIRFLEHPFYRYRVFLLESKTAGQGLLALRVAEHEGRKALRIVDFAGDAQLLASCGVALADVMAQEEAEYADFWELGLPPGVLSSSGFDALDPTGLIVVPNYFEPYLPRNGRILCAFKNSTSCGFRVFRADGDQDRPNRLRAPS
jgi:hypothetical protein